MQFRPAVAAAKPANMAQPSTLKFAAVASYQPRPLPGAPMPVAAPYAAQPVSALRAPSSPAAQPMDIGRYFQMPMGSGFDDGSAYSAPSRAVRTYPRESETAYEPATSAPPAATPAPQSPPQVAASPPTTQSTVAATPDQKGGAAPPPPPPAPESKAASEPAPPQPTAPDARPETPAPVVQTPPPAPHPQEVVKKASEFPQCSSGHATSDPALVEKMFASILKITDTSSQNLRQREKVWMAQPTLTLEPDGRSMHVIIGHPMHNTDAPSSFCQEGNGLRVLMDVSGDEMVRTKVGNTIVAHLVRTGNGTYLSKGADGTITHYALEGTARPGRATASAAMATR